MDHPDQAFFFGKVSRVEAETLLQADGTQGVFLIRTSTQTPGDYVLSLISARKAMHFQIKSQGECWFGIDDGPLFEGLTAICKHYAVMSDGLPTVITRPLYRASRAIGDCEGSLPLHMACYKGNIPSVKTLLKQADVNKTNRRGRTPLHECVRGNQEAAFDLVVGYVVEGCPLADVNAVDDSQWTPLHMAAFVGNYNMILRLLRGGSNPHARTFDGETPQNIAARLGNVQASKLLSYAQTGIHPNFIDVPDRKQPWFHGRISRKAGEYVISKNGSGDGLFIIRDSTFTSGDYVLTTCAGGQAFHFQIQAQDANCFAIDDGPSFEGLARVIEYYRTTSDGLPCVLRQFCSTSESQAGASNTPSTLKPAATTARPVRSSTRQNPQKTYTQIAREDRQAADDDDDYDRADAFSPQGPVLPRVTAATPLMIDAKEIELGAELGAGEFGSVLRGRWRRADGMFIDVAVKTLRQECIGKGEQEFLREANVMLQLDHPNVVRLLGVCLSHPMMIVQELVPLGSLLNYLQKHKAMLRHANLLLFAQQIAAGMMYLEEKRCVHRDLATRNILVASPKLVKISDFGLSRAIGSEDNYYKASAGGKWPVKWYAPESVYFGKFTHKSDVWSYGVTLWEIWTFGALPYEDLTGREVLEMIERKVRLQKPAGCADEVYAVMRSCWEYAPDQRPSFEEIARRIGGQVPPLVPRA